MAVNGALALAAGRARSSLESRPGLRAGAARAVGALLVASAVLTGLEGWRRF